MEIDTGRQEKLKLEKRERIDFEEWKEAGEEII